MITILAWLLSLLRRHIQIGISHLWLTLKIRLEGLLLLLGSLPIGVSNFRARFSDLRDWLSHSCVRWVHLSKLGLPHCWLRRVVCLLITVHWRSRLLKCCFKDWLILRWPIAVLPEVRLHRGWGWNHLGSLSEISLWCRVLTLLVIGIPRWLMLELSCMLWILSIALVTVTLNPNIHTWIPHWKMA